MEKERYEKLCKYKKHVKVYSVFCIRNPDVSGADSTQGESFTTLLDFLKTAVKNLLGEAWHILSCFYW